MKVAIIVLLVCGTFCVDFVTGLTKEEFCECQKAWRALVCEKNDENFLKELVACDELVSEEVINTCRECESTAYSEKFEPVDYVKAACADQSIFDKYDACMDPRINEDFLEKVVAQDEAINCYKKVMEKNGIPLTDSMKFFPSK